MLLPDRQRPGKGITMSDVPLPGIQIRRMLPADIPEVAFIERQVFSDPWSEADFCAELAMEYAYYVTALLEEPSEIAGYCGLLQSFDEAEIVNVAVREEFRGRGIGCRMLKHLMKKGRERGVKRFTLEVRRSNQAALHLYEKLGFVSAGIRPDFYEKPTEDAVILWT